MAAGTTLTVARVQACATALSSVTCADFLSNNPPTECQAVAGTVVDQMTCGDDGQCKSAYCKLGDNGCGKCTARAMAGGTCTVIEDCDYGLLCVTGLGATGRCTKPGAVGDMCSAVAPCLPTLSCKAGACATPAALGATCTIANGQDDCDTNQGLSCDRGSHKCVAVQYASAGEACNVNGRPPIYCSASGTCSLNGGKCVAAAKDGAACGGIVVGGGAECLPPALCEGAAVLRTCKVPDPASCK
jgi:hypothetical protein